MSKRILITICGRAGSKGFRNKNLKTFIGKPISHYSMSAIDLFMQMRPDLEADIVLSTDSGLLREVIVGSYPETIYLHRPAALAADAVVPPYEVLNTLRGSRNDIAIRVDVDDFSYPYRHEDPFPANDKIGPEVDAAFRATFDKIAGFLAGEMGHSR